MVWMHEIYKFYKKYKVYCIFGGILLLACVWFGLAGRGDVSDIGKRADDVRSGLESAGEEQRRQAESLDRAEEGIRNSKERADRIEESERRDAEIIRECKSILATIRGRGEEKD